MIQVLHDSLPKNINYFIIEWFYFCKWILNFIECSFVYLHKTMHFHGKQDTVTFLQQSRWHSHAYLCAPRVCSISFFNYFHRLITVQFLCCIVLDDGSLLEQKKKIKHKLFAKFTSLPVIKQPDAFPFQRTARGKPVSNC